MFNHGTISAMLFILVGVIYERAHHRDIEGFGGLALKCLFIPGLLAFFAGLGLPGLSGFISEAMCFTVPFQCIVDRDCSTIGMLLMQHIFVGISRVFFGKLNEKYTTFQKLIV